MQIGIRLTQNAQGGLEEQLAQARQNGFTCSQITLKDALGLPLSEAGVLTPGCALALRQVFERHQMACALLSCQLNLGTPNRTQLRRTQEIYTAHLRFAKQLGCCAVAAETGTPSTPGAPECHTEQALEAFIENLQPVVTAAEKLGTLLAIEPNYQHIVWNPLQARKVLDAIDSPCLRMILNPTALSPDESPLHFEAMLAQAFDLLNEEIDFISLSGRDMSPSLLKYLHTHKPMIQVLLDDGSDAPQTRIRLQSAYSAL